MAAPLVSTLNLGLQIVVLVVLLVSVTFAKKGTKEGTVAHERLVIVAIILNLVGVILVMIPSLLAYLSIGLASIPAIVLVLMALHGLFGFLGLLFGILFVFSVKPKNIRTWMRLTMLFWFLAVVFGILEYLHIAGAF